MSGKVIFYRLGQKFLDRREDVPAEAKQVVYYSLAIGHHIGVIDCLQPVLDCPLEAFERWIAKLPAEARGKLQGIARWGEINVDASHAAMLIAGLDAARPAFDGGELVWADSLLESLHAMRAEPAIYLIARRRP